MGDNKWVTLINRMWVTLTKFIWVFMNMGYFRWVTELLSMSEFA